MTVKGHDIHGENTGAYVLGALSEIEERSFERHLGGCHVCRDEIERLRPAVDALARSVPPVAPPPRLKAALMEVVEADARARRGGKSLLARSRERIAGLGDVLAGMRPAVAWVSAAFVLLVGVVAGYTVTQVTSGEEGSRTLAAKVDKRTVPFGSGSLLVRDDAREGAILRVHGMPTLESDSVYQVWVRRDGEAISQSLFSVGEDGAGAAAVSDDLEDADAVMVTRERAGGARAPSGRPVLTVSL